MNENIAGIPKKSPISIALFCKLTASFSLLVIIFWDSMGNKAVLRATPIIPRGNWLTLSAKYKNDIEPLGSKDAKWKYEGSYFRKWLNEDGDKGTIRNVYFGHEFLTECFVGASTIADGVEAVWNKFSNAYGGIYDFGIHFDDKEGRLMIKDQGFTQKRVEKVLENKSTNRGYDLEGEETQPGLFVFPVWEKNSLVISQNLNAKLPSRMQIAALYGNNQLEFGDGEINGHKDWGAMALGKAEMATDRKDKQDRMLQDILMGEVDHPFKRHSHPHDNSEATQHKPFTFGNA